ncbi:MAG: sugar ABC transporter permease, partial [Anaerolineae bacterium]|nr:sugar ABC transporter permease [Anaerolineae bacterium]
MVRREALYGYLFVCPQVLGFLLFVLGPVVAVFAFSLQSRSLLSGKATFIGLKNYSQMLFSDPTFIKVLLNSLRFTAGLVPLNIGLSLILALLLSRKMPGVRPFRTLFFAPVVTSGIAWAIVWQFVLQGKQGVLNQLLGMIAIEGPNWLFHPEWAMISVIVTRVIKNVGVNMVIFLAAIQDVPEEQIDAASVDGANTWETIRHIIIPYLAPTVFMATIITVIGSLKVFDHIMALTAAGPANATLVLVFYV